ncbi:MAG: tetratricopeptide repeat protein [Ignavibacteriales bacterium]|nr:tetratricopeptide repeat protein [Ignavibacteriales bacterium]
MRCPPRFLAIILLAFPFQVSPSQWLPDPEIDQRIQLGIDHIYNIEFAAADSIFSDIIHRRPDHPVGYFFRAMVVWWQILTNFDDEAKDAKFTDMLEGVIAMCEKRLDKDPRDVTALFFKGGAVGFRGRLRANRSKWLSAANDGIVALPIVRKAYEIDPKNYDILLGIGIYNYYAEVVPDKYPVVKPFMIFFPSGDRKKGLEQLDLAARFSKYARTEASYFLMQNNFTFEKNYIKALEIARQLHVLYPRNPLFHRYLGRCLVSVGFLSDANEEFVEIEKRFRQKETGYDIYDGREAYYYIGKYDFLAGRLEKALASLFTCDSLSRKIDKDGPSGFMSLANLLIGMIYDLLNKRDHALQQYKKVLAMKEYETSHLEARKYMIRPYKRSQ